MSQVVYDTASKALRAQGLRMTAQRRLILKTLNEATEHLDAETLYQRLRERDRSVSLATVYRTLNVLHKAGLVDQRFLDQDHSRGFYEIREGKEHYHFTCRGCGQVIEFETELVNRLCRELSARHGVRVQRTALHVEGLCAACLNRREE